MDHHDIRLGPKKIAALEVDLLSSWNVSEPVYNVLIHAKSVAIWVPQIL